MPEPVTTEPAEPLAPASATPAPVPGNSGQPTDATVSKADFEKLEMERNMLRNKVDAAEREKREREQKDLEDKEEWRTLAEQNKAELEKLRKEREEDDAKAARENATADVFKDFPDNVQKVARTAGLVATSDADTDKEALRTKLKAIQDEVGGERPHVRGSNPAPTTTPQVDGKKLTAQMHFDDRNMREQAIKTAVGSHPQVQAFREFAKRENNLEAREF